MEKMAQSNLADLQDSLNRWTRLNPTERFDLGVSLRQRLGSIPCESSQDEDLKRVLEELEIQSTEYFRHTPKVIEDLRVVSDTTRSLGLADSASNLSSYATRRLVGNMKYNLYKEVISNGGNFDARTLSIFDGVKGMEILATNAIAAHHQSPPQRVYFKGKTDFSPQGHFMYVNLDPGVWEAARSSLLANPDGREFFVWQTNYLSSQRPSYGSLIAPYESVSAIIGGALAAGGIYQRYYFGLRELNI